jgi:hypothetical protein
MTGYIFIIPFPFYLNTLRNTIIAISEENRKIKANNVWLLLIPVWNVFYQYIVITNLTRSLNFEFKKRGITYSYENPAYVFGMLYCTMFIICCIPFIIDYSTSTGISDILNIIGYIIWAVGIIFWILFWIKTNNYKNILKDGLSTTEPNKN